MNKIAWVSFAIALVSVPSFGSGLQGPDYSSEELVAGQTRYPTRLESADVDGDGQLDLLVASFAKGRVGWVRNLGGGQFGEFHAFSDLTGYVDQIVSLDTNSDGHMDVLVNNGSDVIVYRGLGSGHFIEAQGVTVSEEIRSMAVGDMDGDGLLDVVLTGQFDVTWIKNMGTGQFSAPQVVATGTAGTGPIVSMDHDADGDQDLFMIQSAYGDVTLFSNLGSGLFGPGVELFPGGGSGSGIYRDLCTGDIDGDGDLDLLLGAAKWRELSWMENLGGGLMGPLTQIAKPAPNQAAESVALEDMDQDGDLDAVAAWSGGLRWHENEGAGVFGAAHLIEAKDSARQQLAVGDFDGDGKIDVAHTGYSDHELKWSKNLGLGSFATEQVITAHADYTHTVLGADLDGDGDADMLASSSIDHTIAWYPNLGGLKFGSEQLISEKAAFSPREIITVDFDSDGDLDILAAFFLSDRISWHENLGPAQPGTFAPLQTLVSGVEGAEGVFAEDLDNDGDLDVLFCSSNESLVGWSENLAPAQPGQMGPLQMISNVWDGRASTVIAADFDRDGDADVLVAVEYRDSLHLYENLGNGQFGAKVEISDEVHRVRGALGLDVDLDGDLDMVAASFNDDRIVWFENLGSLSFGPLQVAGAGLNAIYCFAGSDFDGDGDVDLLAGSAYEQKMGWYENQGAGQFGSLQVLAEGLGLVSSVGNADLDNDGDLDALFGSSEFGSIGWLENHMGDSLRVDVNTLSVSAGGTQQFSLYGPDAGDIYLVLGSFSGNGPGFDFGALHVPLNQDAYFAHSLQQIGAAPLSGALGLLTAAPSGGGEASASFVLPLALSPVIVGLELHHAFLTADATTGALKTASNTVSLLLLP